MRKFTEYTLLDNVTPVTVTSSTDATPIVVTATSHGLVTGNQVLIYGHTTNVAANGIFQVIRLTANTFSLVNIDTQASVAGSGAGAGSGGICLLAPKVPVIVDFQHAELQVITSGTATTTIKVAGAIAKSATGTAGNIPSPNFGATVSRTNFYSFVQIINLDTGAAVNGATGIVVAGTDIANSYEVNINAIAFLTVIPVTWSAGAITVKLFVATNQ